MTKLFVHAKLLIDGISATPKLDQLISIEDDKIKAIEDYHEIQENVIEVNTITPGFPSLSVVTVPTNAPEAYSRIRLPWSSFWKSAV